jgi:hypothetical protein
LPAGRVSDRPWLTEHTPVVPGEEGHASHYSQPPAIQVTSADHIEALAHDDGSFPSRRHFHYALVSLRYPLSPSRLPARRGTCVGAGAAAPLPQGLGVWSWMGSRAGRRRRSARCFEDRILSPARLPSAWHWKQVGLTVKLLVGQAVTSPLFCQEHCGRIGMTSPMLLPNCCQIVRGPAWARVLVLPPSERIKRVSRSDATSALLSP